MLDDSGMQLLEFFFRLGVALLMGAAVGWSGKRQRMAGTRTTALVAAGAAAFLMCASWFAIAPPPKCRSFPMGCPASDS